MSDVDLPVAIGGVVAGRYAISGVLGRGGMGVVLAARHLELDQRVAIKFLNREHATLATRFFAEARAASRIKSEHVVRVFDVGRLATGEPYLVMEHLDGEDLAKRLEVKGPMPLVYAADAVLDVCQALAEAHAAGIIHRDLKPANIFISRDPGGDEIVKLLDFGVAKVPEAGTVTKSANVLGSPAYMSPEQLLAARDVDARADIWSLGIILYELLTGELPFEGNSLVHLAMVLREAETPSVHAKRPDLPIQIDDVVRGCLAKERDGRFASVADLAEALAPFVSPALASSIPRIRRVLTDKSGLAMASTLPLEKKSNPPEAVGQRKRATATISGVSTSTESADAVAAVGSNASGAELGPRRSRRLLVGMGAGVMVLGLVAVMLVRAMAPSPPLQDAGRVTSALVVSSPTMPSAEPLPTVSTTVASTTDTSDSGTVQAVVAPPKASRRAADPPRKPEPVKSAAPSTTAPPAPNCNPPYRVDEAGVRRVKPECL